MSICDANFEWFDDDLYDGRVYVDRRYKYLRYACATMLFWARGYGRV